MKNRAAWLWVLPALGLLLASLALCRTRPVLAGAGNAASPALDLERESARMVPLFDYPEDRPMSSGEPPGTARTKARYTAASTTSSKWESTFAGEALTNCTRDRFIDFSAASDALGLAPTYLIADAMARSSKISEPLTDQIQVKKVFELPSAVEKAEILFFGGGGSEQTPMLIAVNGHEIRHVQNREKMLTGGWDRETIPGHYLQQGSNELIFSGAGFLLIDADRPGKNSFKRLSGESSRVEERHTRAREQSLRRVRRPHPGPRLSARGDPDFSDN